MTSEPRVRRLCDLGEKKSRQRAQQVQRPCGGNLKSGSWKQGGRPLWLKCGDRREMPPGALETVTGLGGHSKSEGSPGGFSPGQGHGLPQVLTGPSERIIEAGTEAGRPREMRTVIQEEWGEV